MKVVDSLTKRAWKCNQCAKKFTYESDMRRHELSHVPQFECKRCCKKFSYLSALRRHEKTHGRSGSVQCAQCGGHFRDEVLLKRHVRYSHKGTYKCDKCTATFNSEPALSTHKKTHKPASERRFRCSYGCGKSFNFSHHLKHHEMTHTNTKQHFCQTCGKGFIQSHHLKTHEKTHDPKYWLPCTVSDCKKKFVDEYARKRHLATHRKAYQVGSSSDSSVAACKISPSEDSQAISLIYGYDGESLTSQRKSNISSSRNIIVKCEEKGTLKTEIILNSQFNDYESADSQNNIVLEKGVLNERDNDFLDVDIKTCKTVIGSCLVTGDSKVDQSCLCAQITNPTCETDEEFVLAPNNETLNVNAKEIIKKSHDCDCCLLGSIPDCNKKFVNDSTGIKSMAKHNGEMRCSREQPIVVHSSDGCKSTKEQRAVETRILNPPFNGYEHKDSQNNNTKENYSFHRRDDNLDKNESDSANDGGAICKIAVGNSSVSRESDEDDNCVKISNQSESEECALDYTLESYNKILAVNTARDSNGEVRTNNSVVSLQQDFEISSYESMRSKCEGCECANLCSISDKLACKKEESNIKYFPGGIVKLKETIDFDFHASAKEGHMIKDVIDETNNEINDCNSSNFKSCKDVIGNCIVSGNSTMGEGCLCAKMMVDNQAMAEEIDEITPCPQGAA